MSITLDEFIKKYTGKYVESNGNVTGDGGFRQCVDLVNAYLYEVVNGTMILHTNAIDFPSKISNDCVFIKNTLNGVPLAGDVVVWGKPLGKYTDAGRTVYAGHIAIFISGDASKFTSFDQNWPAGSPPAVTTHKDYTGVLGWIHKNASPPPSPVPPVNPALIYSEADMTAMRVARDTNWNNYQAEIAAYNQVVNELAVVNKNLTDEKDAHTADLEAIAIEYAVPAKMEKILPEVKASIGFEDQAKELTKLRQDEQAQYARDLKAATDKIQSLEKQFNDLKNQLAILADKKPEAPPSVVETKPLNQWLQIIIHWLQRKA